MSSPFTAVGHRERHAILDGLNRRGPIHRVPLPNGTETWLVTGYDTARIAFTDPHLVKGGPVSGPYADRLPPDTAHAIYHHMLIQNPPDHTRLRRLVAAAFTGRRVDRLVPRIQQIADQLVDEFADLDRVDLLGAYAYPLPITVICELLGVPVDDRPAFRAWTGPIVGGMTTPYEVFAAAATAVVGHTRELLARKRRDPGEDLLSALIATRDEGGDALTEDELTSMVFLLIAAGHETTVNLILNGVLALLEHPDQLAELRARPARIEAAIEEVLRWDCPVQTAVPLICAVPTTLGGVTVAAGEVVLVSPLAANRDPDRVTGPGPGADRLDLGRRDTPHLAFGYGVHHCLGAALARTEGRIALGTLLDRFPDLELAVPVEELARLPGLLLNGLAGLPVRLR